MECDKCGQNMPPKVKIEIVDEHSRWLVRHFCGIRCAKQYLYEDCEEVNKGTDDSDDVSVFGP